MKSIEYVTALYDYRKSAPDQQWRQDALIVKAMLNNDLWAPVDDRVQAGEAQQYAAVANAALSNLEGMVNRICSTQPNIKFVPLRSGSNPSIEKARQRRLASLAMWDQNEVNMKDRKRVRWLRGYGVGPVQITTHPTKPIPKWVNRDPLMTYAAPSNEDTGFVPNDCIFAYHRTYAWLELNYPLKAFMFNAELTNRKQPCRPDQKFEIIEYVDANERILVLRHRDATSSDATMNFDKTPKQTVVELDRIESRIGICPIVAPSMIGIDRIRSPYMDNVGIQIMQNKLAVLSYIFAERAVFADQYFVEPTGSANGDIVELADGPSGKIGHLRGGSLETVAMQPNFSGTQMMDRLEREGRISNSTPAEWNGESASNIRTAVRGNNIAQEAVNYTILEHQEVLSLAKENELKIAIKIDKEFYNKDKSFYIGWKGDKSEKIDYKPSEIWENDEVHVFYSAAGADINAQVISGGQRIAQGTLSKRTFMEMDPFVEDAEVESDAIVAEQLEQSILAEFLQPGGALDVVAKAEVANLVRTNKMNLSDAVAEVQKRRQEAQASKDAQGVPTGVDPASPSAQPGIAPQAAAGIAGPSPDQQNLSSILGALRKPQMSVNGA